MQYYDEMQTKYGFGDGGSIPPDAQACRTVYVEALNQVAASLGSEVRACEYDRPGVHNPVLIQFRGKDAQPGNDCCDPDERMLEAIERCYKMDLDFLVKVRVTIDPRYKETISRLAKEVDNDRSNGRNEEGA